MPRVARPARSPGSLSVIGPSFCAPGTLPKSRSKRPEWKVPGLPCDFDEKAIREPEPRPLQELVQGGSHDLVILNGQVLMVEEHLNGLGDLGRTAIVN